MSYQAMKRYGGKLSASYLSASEQSERSQSEKAVYYMIPAVILKTVKQENQWLPGLRDEGGRLGGTHRIFLKELYYYTCVTAILANMPIDCFYYYIQTWNSLLIFVIAILISVSVSGIPSIFFRIYSISFKNKTFLGAHFKTLSWHLKV